MAETRKRACQVPPQRRLEGLKEVRSGGYGEIIVKDPECKYPDLDEREMGKQLKHTQAFMRLRAARVLCCSRQISVHAHYLSMAVYLPRVS